MSLILTCLMCSLLFFIPVLSYDFKIHYRFLILNEIKECLFHFNQHCKVLLDLSIVIWVGLSFLDYIDMPLYKVESVICLDFPDSWMQISASSLWTWCRFHDSTSSCRDSHLWQPVAVSSTEPSPYLSSRSRCSTPRTWWLRVTRGTDGTWLLLPSSGQNST